MARFKIELEGGESLDYETDPASLRHADGSAVGLDPLAMSYTALRKDDDAMLPLQRVNSKYPAPNVLKLQLGLSCNFSCSYCMQAGQQGEPASTESARDFPLDWLDDAPGKVEFWGGEPLLYWKRLVALTERMNEKFGPLKKSVVTNGSLLTRDRIDWLFDNGFTVAISHDGPAQGMRGADPLDDQEMLENWRYLFRRFGSRATINVVLGPKNCDLGALWAWFQDRLGEAATVNIENVVTDYGNSGLSDAELAVIHRSVRSATESGLALAFERIRIAAQYLLVALAIERPLNAAGQVCAMDLPDHIAVDLAGNVLTCQNVGAKSGHAIGTIADLDAVALDVERFTDRPHCSECPVVLMCYGSCMLLKGDAFESSCRASYHYNLAILFGLLKLLTGRRVVSINGWKPAKVHRTIMLRKVG